jgi:hypothetical protein
MSQHDMDIANQGFAATRVDMNAALQALVSNSSGATEPTATYPFQFWADTTAGIMKQRNAANSAWVNLFTLSTGSPTASDLAKLNAAQTFTAQQTPSNGTLTDATTVAWDGDTNGQVVKLTLTAARTMGAPTHITENNIYVLRLTTGGFTPSWNSAFKWSTVPSALENAVYVGSFIGGAGNTLIPMGDLYKTGA